MQPDYGAKVTIITITTKFSVIKLCFVKDLFALKHFSELKRCFVVQRYGKDSHTTICPAIYHPYSQHGLARTLRTVSKLPEGFLAQVYQFFLLAILNL